MINKKVLIYILNLKSIIIYNLRIKYILIYKIDFKVILIYSLSLIKYINYKTKDLIKFILYFILFSFSYIEYYKEIK